MSEIYGFKVGSTTYQYDYDHLANKPEPVPEYDSNYDYQKVLAVSGHDCLEWMKIADLLSDDEPHDGDVLMYVSNSGDDLHWRTLIPAYSCGDNGKVLAISEYGEGFEWKIVPPVPESYDVGKALVVYDTYGTMSWEEIFPEYDEDDDNGKVLAVGDHGELEWVRMPGLPDTGSCSEGEALVIVSNSGELEPRWGRILPSYSNSDSGKVLTVTSNGDLAWLPVGSM